MLSSKYMVIDDATGAIVREGQCSAESLDMQGGDGLTVVTDIPVGVSDISHYWHDMGFIPYPEKPGPWAVWDGLSWIDPRTPEDHEAALESMRAAASLTKLQFVMAVVQGGIISQASGLAMLDGTLPAELAGLTDSMSDMEKFELAAKLKGAQQIDRLDPFIVASGQFLGLTDEQMDAVFGIEPPD